MALNAVVLQSQTAIQGL